MSLWAVMGMSVLKGSILEVYHVYVVKIHLYYWKPSLFWEVGEINIDIGDRDCDRWVSCFLKNMFS